MTEETSKRAIELLTAVCDLLMQQEETCATLNILERTVYYDDCYCSGECLLYDIKALLEEVEVKNEN